MNLRGYYAAMGMAAVLSAGALVSSAGVLPFNATLKPGPNNSVECWITALNQDVSITDYSGFKNAAATTTTVHCRVFKDDPPGSVGPSQGSGIPGPLIRIAPGTMVICHFKNLLTNNPEGASIHWHGIELDNDSDGTGVTQDTIYTNQTYTYQFIAPRPGVFWYHSHMTPGDTTFEGMYGAIIIANASEPALIASGVLPPAAFTFPLVMSDINYNPANGYVGNVLSNNYVALNDLIEACHAGGNGTPACGAAGAPAPIVLVNGVCPEATPRVVGGGSTNYDQSLCNPTNFYTVPNNSRVRLQLFSEAVSRDFRLTLRYCNTTNTSANTNLYRIGGQGGLLNNIRLEGGTNNGGTWVSNINAFDTGYGLGELVLGSGERSDVMFYATGSPGDIIALIGNPLPNFFNLSGANSNSAPTINKTPNYPVAYFKISGSTNNTVPMQNDALVANALDKVTSIKTLPTNSLAPVPSGLKGTNTYLISLNQSSAISTNKPGGTTLPNIDNWDASQALDGNMGNGALVAGIPQAPNTRYAYIGSVLQLSVANTTGTIHPYHLHGFSMQPISIKDQETGMSFTYAYNEYVDTIEIYPGETLTYRIKLDDRPKICDSATGGPQLFPCTGTNLGGGLGRWLMHCHIFLHGAIGMIAELDVLPLPQQNQVLQPPDLTTNAIATLSTFRTGSQMVADDFNIATNGNVSDIHFWGAWKNNLVETNTTFELKFWTDVPTGNSALGFGYPGWQTWYQQFAPGGYTSLVQVTNVGAGQFFDPSVPSMGTYSRMYRYDITVPTNQAFSALSNNFYWMSITAYPTNTNALFGWITTNPTNHYRSFATWSGSLIGPNWSNLVYPAGVNTGLGMDMAFALNTGSSVFPAPTFTLPGMPPTLFVTTTPDGQISISWDGTGTLQNADDLSGPWTNIDFVTSPYVAPSDKPQSFYRLVQP